MTIDSRDFAAISDDTYKDRAVGRRVPGKEEHVTLNGHDYNILEHVNNRPSTPVMRCLRMRGAACMRRTRR